MPIPEIPTDSDAKALLNGMLSSGQKFEILRYDCSNDCPNGMAGLILSIAEAYNCFPDKLNTMINIELSNREIQGPGLYLMQWNKQTGLVRIVGQSKSGYMILQPEKPSEHYFQGLPAKGTIPHDALISELLNVTKA